jgi:uncharacterized protein (DUF1330 family)
MKTNYKILCGVLIGALIGAAGVTVIHAQQAKVLPGYVVSEVDVTDPATFKEYADKAPSTVAASNGRFLIRGGKVEAIEGQPPKRFVVIQFDSFEKAKAFENSPAYNAIRPIRLNSAKSRVFIIEGAGPQ